MLRFLVWFCWVPPSMEVQRSYADPDVAPVPRRRPVWCGRSSWTGGHYEFPAASSLSPVDLDEAAVSLAVVGVTGGFVVKSALPLEGSRLGKDWGVELQGWLLVGFGSSSDDWVWWASWVVRPTSLGSGGLRWAGAGNSSHSRTDIRRCGSLGPPVLLSVVGLSVSSCA